MRATASPRRGLVPLDEIAAVPPVRIGHHGLAADLVEGDVLRRMARRGRRSAAPRRRAPDSSPPIAAPACRPSSRRRPRTACSMPRWSSSIACARTMSRMVMTGKSRPHGLPVAGLVEAGPGRAHAAADHVRADDEIALGVDRLARPDHRLPPARLAGHRMHVGDVLVAGQRVADQHRVASAAAFSVP